jgi:hypothetical protein
VSLVDSSPPKAGKLSLNWQKLGFNCPGRKCRLASYAQNQAGGIPGMLRLFSQPRVLRIFHFSLGPGGELGADSARAFKMTGLNISPCRLASTVLRFRQWLKVSGPLQFLGL